MESFFAKVKFFRFWPKTMDYNKAFWLKSRSFFVVVLLQNGRCYEAEFCAILFLLRSPFPWNPFFAKVKFFRFWSKTMDYSPWFDFGSPKNILREVYHSKENEKRNLMALVSVT